MNNKKSGSPGFTLFELMIVVSILGILAVIALPKFALALQKSKEGSAKGNLGTVRTAVAVYYADHEGQFPPDLATLIVNRKYLGKIPPAVGLSRHADTNSVHLQTSADDAGGWVYNATQSDGNYGTVLINCTHADSAGKVWTSY